MRILIDVESDQVKRLDTIAKSRKASRAAVIREAIEQHIRQVAGSGSEAAFGLWRGLDVDGLDYQEKMRSEW